MERLRVLWIISEDNSSSVALGVRMDERFVSRGDGREELRSRRPGQAIRRKRRVCRRPASELDILALNEAARRKSVGKALGRDDAAHHTRRLAEGDLAAVGEDATLIVEEGVHGVVVAGGCGAREHAFGTSALELDGGLARLQVHSHALDVRRP